MIRVAAYLAGSDTILVAISDAAVGFASRAACAARPTTGAATTRAAHFRTSDRLCVPGRDLSFDSSSCARAGAFCWWWWWLGLGIRELQRLVWAHLGGVVQYFCMAQPATLKPGASPRHVELHATLQRLDLPAASHVGTSGAFVGGHVQTLPLAHDGVDLVQYDSMAQPATLKPGADPRHVDTHASSHMSALPIEAHDGATASSVGAASIWVGATVSSPMIMHGGALSEQLTLLAVIPYL